MNRKVHFLVNTFIFLCHLFLRTNVMNAQVPSQLQKSGDVVIAADTQEKTGQKYDLHGKVSIHYGEMELTSDAMNYDADTGIAMAKGNVHFTRAGLGEEFWATDGEYNLRTGAGRFQNVIGNVGGHVRSGSSILSTSNPFYLEAERVDRTEEQFYRVYNAKITVCSMPDPTWNFIATEATIRPNDSAYIYHSKLKVLNLPVFYFPVFYHSLKENPRNSGFLIPSVGNNSRLGYFVGDSFFWAINRSADAEIGAQYLSLRGWSQSGSLRFRPSANNYLNMSYYGVLDRGYGTQKIDQGGRTATATGIVSLPLDFRGVVDFHYLSSLTFRQAFTQTYNEAVFSENHSSGFVTKNGGSYSLNGLMSNLQNFESGQVNDSITIRQLPEIEFNSVERTVFRNFPLRVSWQTSAGMVSRDEPTVSSNPTAGSLKTGTLNRLEFYPRATIPLRWGAFHLTASAGYRARRYSDSRDGSSVMQSSLYSGSHDFSVELAFPALSRNFSSLGPIHRSSVRHVIEPKATFNFTGGVKDFSNILLFDERDLVSNTKNLEYSISNRILATRGGGVPAQEIFSWQLKQQYYFDPSFGSSVIELQRNVLLPVLEFSGNSFLYGQRKFSPIVSLLRFHPLAHYGVELRQDYDTTLKRFTNAAFSGDVNYGQVFASVSEFVVRSPAALSPPSDQIHITAGYGKQGRAVFFFE